MRFYRGWCLLLMLFFAPAQADDGFAPAAGDVRPLMVGAEVPSVKLVDASGAAFELRANEKQKPIIAVFYRGYW